MLLSETINYERFAGQVSRDLRTALQMLESKFCYMRWDGLVLLLELVTIALKDTQKIGPFLSNLMAKHKMQQVFFFFVFLFFFFVFFFFFFSVADFRSDH
jgi:hypothetical protein